MTKAHRERWLLGIVKISATSKEQLIYETHGYEMTRGGVGGDIPQNALQPNTHPTPLIVTVDL